MTSKILANVEDMNRLVAGLLTFRVGVVANVERIPSNVSMDS